MVGKHANNESEESSTVVDGFASVPGERKSAIINERLRDNGAYAPSEPLRNKDRRIAKAKRQNKNRSFFDWVILVIAELLITLGVIAGLFLLWKFVINDWVTDTQEQNSAQALSQKFKADAGKSTLSSLNYNPQDPPVMSQDGLKEGEQYGVIYIPRLSPTYKRVLAEGTSINTLWAPNSGVGHYDSSQMPGAYGNYALAGHRNTVFKNLATLVPGDKIYIETKDGYYTYEVEQPHSIVLPTAVQVIAPIPGNATSTVEQATAANSRIMTLTTCWPDWSNTQRLIVYTKFVSWQPLAAGAPAAIAKVAG